MAPPDVESPAPPTPPRRRRGARLLIVLIALWAGSAAADDLGGPLLVPVAGVRPAQLHSTLCACATAQKGQSAARAHDSTPSSS